MGPYFFRNPFGFYPFPRFYNVPYGYYNNNQYKSHKYQPSQSSEHFSKKNKSDENEINHFSDSIYHDKPIFELFGIKLFFDDILIISLIFFLYNEGVKDQNLFIALILLLLS